VNKKADPYHHGNLRQALIETARELLHAGGVEALTLREVARRAGVTTAAPYHHFADKAALVDALVRQSLAELDAASREALHGISEPRAQLRALGLAYVLYALDHPAEFRLMFRPELGTPINFEAPGSAPVFSVLADVIAAGHGPESSQAEREVAALTAWSLVHGLAALIVDGPLGRHAMARDELISLAQRILAKLDLV